DGTISVSSQGKGHGSTFSLRLPTIVAPVAPPAEPVQESMQPATDAVPAGGHVLVVDDNIDAAEILSLLLEMSGYTVDTCHTAGEALAWVKQNQPEIVILDIGLPDKNGRELAQEIRQVAGMDKSLLVALSGFGQQKDIEASLEAGLDVHLTKPVSQEELLRTLQNGSLKKEGQPVR